jgi:DHA3 family macrolide efflux protein-like MFS transporter
MAKTFARGMPVFVTIWLGQLVSLVGSGLTSFSLGVWVYQRTGSVTQYALVTLFITLPGVILSPFAGALVDRWDRRRMMIVSDLGAGLGTVVVALLLISGRLNIWEVYVVVALRAGFGIFRWPAYAAMTTQIVPKEKLGRANGMIQAAQAASAITPPVLAGALMGAIHIEGVILIDCVTFVLAIVTLLPFSIARPEVTAEGRAGKGSVWSEAAYGWHYIRQRFGLLALAILMTLINLELGVVEVLVTPLVLSVASPAQLGTVLSLGGIGMLVGSLVMIIWRGPRRKMAGVYGFLLLAGSSVALGGIRPGVPFFIAAAFGFFFSLAFINGYSWAIWQSKVAPDVQGRVFATVQMVASAAMPAGHLLAGPLADRVFEPLLMAGGPLAATVGAVIGTGVGRGIGLLFILLGGMMIVITILGVLQPRLRRVEDELPEAKVVSTQPAPAAGT